MADKLIICGCRHGLTWLLFLLLQLSSIGLIVASVFVKEWVSNTGYSSGLYKCSDSSCVNTNYKNEADLYCNADSKSSGCKFYRGLEYGMIAYLVCAGMAVISTILWIFPSLCFMCRKSCCGCGCFSGALATLAQIAGVIAYALLANLRFSDCHASFANGSQPYLCVEIGYQLAIAAAADCILIMFFYIVCGCSTRQKLQKVNREALNQTGLKNQSMDQSSRPIEKGHAWSKN